VIEKWVYQKSQQKYATKVNKCNWRVPILWTFKQFGSDRKNQIQRRKIMSTQSVKPVLSSEKTILKVRKAVIPNHSQAALKVRKGTHVNHNETTLKVRKDLHENHNQNMLSAQRHYQQS
jgi:hypothetical protein